MGDFVMQDFAGATGDTRPDEIEQRLLTGMKWTALAAVLISAPFTPWRSTVGIALGAALAVLNFYWLHRSVSAMFSPGTANPKIKASAFLLRYFVIVAAISLAKVAGLISIPATIAGLSIFVVPFMIEAGRRFYIAIFSHEDR